MLVRLTVSRSLCPLHFGQVPEKVRSDRPKKKKSTRLSTLKKSLAYFHRHRANPLSQSHRHLPQSCARKGTHLRKVDRVCAYICLQRTVHPCLQLAVHMSATRTSFQESILAELPPHSQSMDCSIRKKISSPEKQHDAPHTGFLRARANHSSSIRKMRIP